MLRDRDRLAGQFRILPRCIFRIPGPGLTAARWLDTGGFRERPKIFSEMVGARLSVAAVFPSSVTTYLDCQNHERLPTRNPSEPKGSCTKTWLTDVSFQREQDRMRRWRPSFRTESAEHCPAVPSTSASRTDHAISTDRRCTPSCEGFDIPFVVLAGLSAGVQVEVSARALRTDSRDWPCRAAVERLATNSTLQNHLDQSFNLCYSFSSCVFAVLRPLRDSA